MGRDGEAADFNVFYEASYGQLVAHLYALTGDLGEAQDAAQEAFIRAWDRWHQVSTHDNPVAWVRLTGQRVAISRWRRARTAVRSWVRHGPAGPVAGPGPDTVALVEALRRLPEAQRSALVLHHMGGRSVAEIAAEGGVPVGTVKARLHRGRQALAVLLDEEPARPPEEPVVTGRRLPGADGDAGPGAGAGGAAQAGADAEDEGQPVAEPVRPGDVEWSGLITHA
ncbi:SigE family RNA polymerase sigma factor [Kitasatospora sp. NPDC057223]|uniref:SigE family RNA polymerase sigma factor n=1 Tax=Kitasatospora sp. NPDC057223 TaxID=3346055 RepID=UPI0036388689